MRILAAAVVALLAGIGQGIAASASPGYTAEEAHAGCYHTDLRVCVISLGTVFWFDMTTVAAQIAKRNELDVNGHTAHRKIVIDARLPGHTDYHRDHPDPGLAGAQRPDRQDRAGPARRPRARAHRNGIRSHAALRCRRGGARQPLSRARPAGALPLLRENSIKPREIVKSSVQKYGIFHYTWQTVDTEPMPFCGAMFSLHGATEFNGTPDMPNRQPKTLSFITIE